MCVCVCVHVCVCVRVCVCVCKYKYLYIYVCVFVYMYTQKIHNCMCNYIVILRLLNIWEVCACVHVSCVCIVCVGVPVCVCVFGFVSCVCMMYGVCYYLISLLSSCSHEGGHLDRRNVFYPPNVLITSLHDTHQSPA